MGQHKAIFKLIAEMLMLLILLAWQGKFVSLQEKQTELPSCSEKKGRETDPPFNDGPTRRVRQRRTSRKDGNSVHNRRAQGRGLINTKHFKGNPTLPHSESAGARDKRLIKHTRRRGCSAARRSD